MLNRCFSVALAGAIFSGAVLVAAEGDRERPPAPNARRDGPPVREGERGDMPRRRPDGPPMAGMILQHAEALNLTAEQKALLEAMAKGPISVLTPEQQQKLRELRPRDGAPRPDGERPPRADGPRPDGERVRPDGERPRPDGERPRPDGERVRRGEGDAPRGEGLRPRRDGEPIRKAEGDR